MTPEDVGGEIRLGSMLFTMVEPHPGAELAYNRWYERDHFYAGCMVGPWMFAGRRWVATRDLKDLRFGAEPDVFGGRDLGSYLAVYWILDGRHDEHVAWALRQVTWLHANGRMFAARDHVHTLLYRLAHRSDTVGGDGSTVAAVHVPGMAAELALDHPFGALVAALVEAPTDGPPDDAALTAWLDAAPGIDLALGWDPIPLPADAPVTQHGLEHLDRRRLVLGFGAGTPTELWPAVRAAADAFERTSGGTVLWAGPFRPTIPGTDTYADQLR